MIGYLSKQDLGFLRSRTTRCEMDQHHDAVLRRTSHQDFLSNMKAYRSEYFAPSICISVQDSVGICDIAAAGRMKSGQRDICANIQIYSGSNDQSLATIAAQRLSLLLVLTILPCRVAQRTALRMTLGTLDNSACGCTLNCIMDKCIKYPGACATFV